MNTKTLITPRTFYKNYLKDLWVYREVLWVLSWRDLKVRYKQTFIGILWAILRPLITMVLFAFVFGQVGGLAEDARVPYSLVVLTGILPWQFFSQTVTDGATSVVRNERLITKTYFPRLLIPLSTVVTTLVDFAISMILLLCLFFYFDQWPSWKSYFILLFMLLLVMIALGTGLILAALNVKFRDFRYIIPFMLQVGLFISPVGFDTSAVPPDWRLIFSLNPLVGVIEGFRWALLDGVLPTALNLAYSIAFGLGLFFSGIYTFVRQEKYFADYI